MFQHPSANHFFQVKCCQYTTFSAWVSNSALFLQTNQKGTWNDLKQCTSVNALYFFLPLCEVWTSVSVRGCEWTKERGRRTHCGCVCVQHITVNLAVRSRMCACVCVRARRRQPVPKSGKWRPHRARVASVVGGGWTWWLLTAWLCVCVCVSVCVFSVCVCVAVGTDASIEQTVTTSSVTPSNNGGWCTTM